jgi:2-amino-4-hydroxy-6-hydroxymethyldihydropteridine diphosphokinase
MTALRWTPAYVGIGSNLESPEEQVGSAIRLLRELPLGRLIAVSGLYQSAPLCQHEQPDFINAVAALVTQNEVYEFLQQLQELEERQGRIRNGERWEARVLDLDLLAFGGRVLTDDRLTLPHPGIAVRNFVLLPWQEITPQYMVPGLASVGELAAQVSTDDPRIRRMK